MNSAWYCKVVIVMVAFLATAGTGYAQLKLIDNKVEKGRLGGARQVDVWYFALDEKTKTVTIDVTCDTTEVIVFLQKQGGQEWYILLPNKGVRSNGQGVRGNAVSAYPDPIQYPALDRGLYKVVVQAANGEGTGDYTIQIPELGGPNKQPVRGNAPETKAQRLERLRKELEATRMREEKLLSEIRMLESEGKK